MIFGFIADGSCDVLAGGVRAGSNRWILKSSAEGHRSRRRKAVRGGKAQRASRLIFIIRAGPDKQRDATILNLDHAGFGGLDRALGRDPDRG